MRFFFLTMIFVFCMASGFAQDCPQFPADCPADQLPDSVTRMDNPLVPQEISMEFRVGDFFTGLMQRIADKKGWKVYAYDESNSSGYQNADRSAPLEYKLRPPHHYEISFVFIVNKDSMKAWKDWFMNDLKPKMESADFSNFDALQKMMRAKTIAYRNSAMIRVKLDVNRENAAPSSVLETIHSTGRITVPEAAAALMFHNSEPDEKAIYGLDQFTRCTDFAFVLFGKWNLKPDEYQIYRPSYASVKSNTDLTSIKVVSCDKVRTIAMHVEGDLHYIHLFLSSPDIQQLNNLIRE